MKIIYPLHFPGRGGAERYVLLLAKRARQEGHQILFLFGGDGPFISEVKKAGFSYQFLKMKHPFDLVAVVKLAKIIKTEKPDVIHTQFLRENFIAILASKISRGPKIFSTVHRIEPKNLIQRTFNRIFSRGLVRFIAVSQVAEEYLLEEGINREKIVIIYNGTELSVKRESRQKHSDLIIGYAGRLSAEKNVPLLLKAVSLIKNTCSFQIQIAGDGPERDFLEQESMKRGLENRVHFLGHIKDLSKKYSEWDILILPSRLEVFPMVLLEAMSYGVPVIASRVGGNQELIKDGISGLLFESDNAEDLAKKIKEFVRDRKLQKTLSLKGRLRAEEFSAGKMAQETFKVYREF